MDVLNKKGFVKIGVGAGLIIAIAVLIFFSSSLLSQIAAPTDLTGNIVDDITDELVVQNTNKPILIDFAKMGGDDEGDDETGESEEEDESDDEDEGSFFITGGSFPTGGDGGITCCPPPTHKECDYENEQCIVVQGAGDDECQTDEDCYCDPKTPGYWENHLSEAEGLLDCVHDNYDVFDYVENQSDITYVLECSGNCSNMFNKLKKFLLATILNICADYFDLDDAYDGKTIEYWIDHSVVEVENGESDMDEYYKDALDAILNGELECNPETHTECNYVDLACDSVLGSGDDECETYEDCEEECIPPYLAVDKTAEPTEVICEEVTITLEVSGKGEVCDGFYPVDVVLVFDNSGSMDDDGWDDNISDWQPIGDAKIAAKDFVDILGTNDKAGLVSFNTVATLEQGLTFDKNAVKTAIDGMSAGGWTNMSQGIDFANEELINNGRTDTPWVEVLLSDGNNNCGSKDPPADCHQRVFDSAQEAADNGIVIYTIALGNNSNQSLMEEIANITGGKSYYAPDSEDLEEIYEEIAEEVTTIAGTNIVVIDYLPGYVELNESTLPPECTYDDIERKITCELDDLHINETATITFNIYLHQFGYTLTNVYPDSGVEYLNYNGTTIFEEFPETYVTSLDCDHTVCNYIDMTCDLVLEPGDDECETFEDCPQHTECDYQLEQCVTVEGSGENQCLNWDDCIHTECCGMSCITVQSQGIDQCVTDADCTDHICNYVDLTCDTIPGSGYVECETFQDCPQYTECDHIQQACVTVQGIGKDECETYDDCFHTECSEGYCIDVQGVGIDQCETDMECRHFECNYVDLICEEIFAVGASECQTFLDCPQHTECDYQLDQCVTVEGADEDQCITYSDCLHTECNYVEFTCDTIESQGIDECVTFEDCIHTECNYVDLTCDIIEAPGTYECIIFDDCPQHTECDYVGQACVIAEGEEADECITYNDCIHTECNYVDLTCDLVETPGIYECETFQDCPQYTECDHIQQACVTVQGIGKDECSTYSDCIHTECNYVDLTCDTIQSSGIDECVTFEDCYYCGNGILEPGEECETTGNYSGWGPWGHEYTCKEDNTYYHCVNCQYEHVNECEYYCSGDVECDGIPPMTYLDTCTAYGYDYLQDYCNEICELEDNNCEDDYFGCTSDPQCDELPPNTGDCNYMCQYKPSHTECNYQAQTCDLVQGPGVNECVTFEDCPMHKECDYQLEQCVVVGGPGDDECSTYSDCIHTECNYVDLTCDIIEAPGPYECIIFDDCPQHTECDYVGQACVIAEGEEADECITYNDCLHTECNYVDLTCDLVETPGIYECETFEDCPHHTECDYVQQACVTVQGIGKDECSTYDDCIHTECNYVDLTCDTIQSSGIDECVTFEDCYYCGNGILEPGEECETTGNYSGWGPWGHEYTCKEDNTYYHCVNCQYEHVNECEYYCSGDVECDGIPPMTYLDTCTAYGYDYLQDYCNEICELEDNNCEDDYFGCTSDPQCDELPPNTGDCNYMCQYKPSHTECNYQAQTCDLVQGPGVNECVTFQDCPQHKECDYQLEQCVIVEGSGEDQCLNWDNCIHTECNYIDLTCDTVLSRGISECVTFEDCPQHRICDYQLEQCRIVEGSGDDECLVWGDCLYCGDGIVTSPEECELPGTNNNPYCSQTTQACSGKKLGVRDAFGYCNEYCGCIDDPFSYSCVKGQCGAECDSDDDCPCPGDKCHHRQPIWLDYPDYSTCSEDCVCADCEPTGYICDPRCMGNCEVEVKTGHDMNPDWPDGPPYTVTDDIWIMATDVSNGACDGWTIRIRYWWCSCPNQDPEQSAIEYTDRPKYDRLCSANAAGEDNPTHSLQCAPCEWRDYWPEFPKDSGKKFWTGSGSSTGTFQIDIREYHDCYERVYPVALACAAYSEDQPVETETHLECSGKQCVEISGNGQNQCSEDCDCYFYKCVDQACVKRAGTQANQCSTDADCIETHLECSGKQCVQVAGSGQDLCNVDNDCYFYKCDYTQQACVKRAGTQADQCSVWEDCIHNECVGFTCESVLSPGLDECYDNWDCEPEPPEPPIM